MSERRLLDEYEATGNEGTYVEARRRYEDALATAPDDARLHYELGYLDECRARLALRAAVTRYERAIELEPGWEKPRHQLIAARASLHETSEAIALYKQRLAAAPDDVREYRYLAQAYLIANEYEDADAVIRAGLTVSPDDAMLVEQQGELCAATGRPDEALAHWRRVFELDPERVDPHYGAAFLLEREGRLEDAIREWRFIVDWLTARGYAVQADWPKREVARLEAKVARR